MALILFNDWIIFHCIYVPHLSIHSSLSGPLGCFQVLAAVGSATVTTEDTCPFKPCLSGWTPSSGMRTCGSSVPFHRQLRAALRGCASPTPARCSTPSPGFTVCRFFDDGHIDWCEMVSHCSFDLHFSKNDWQCWAPFYVTCMNPKWSEILLLQKHPAARAQGSGVRKHAGLLSGFQGSHSFVGRSRGGQLRYLTAREHKILPHEPGGK